MKVSAGYKSLEDLTAEPSTILRVSAVDPPDEHNQFDVQLIQTFGLKAHKRWRPVTAPQSNTRPRAAPQANQPQSLGASKQGPPIVARTSGGSFPAPRTSGGSLAAPRIDPALASP